MALPPDPFTKSRERDILREAIGDVVARDGCLANAEAIKLAEVFGCTVRTVYRHARSVRDAVSTPATKTATDDAVEDGPLTFLDRIARGDGFFPDELFWDLYYLCSGNMVRVKSEIERLGYPMPSLPTLSRIKRRQPPLFQDGARHGLANRNRCVLHVRHSAAFANEEWQVDELIFDIDVLAAGVRRGRGGTVEDADGPGTEPRIIQPRLVIFEDDYSRFIPAWSVLPGAVNSAEFLATMAAGMEVRPAENTSGDLIGGPPDTLVFDNAQAFRSFLVADCLTTLPIAARPTPAYAPTAKGKVERAIQTIQDRVITGLPGIRSRATRLDGSDILGLDAGYFLEFDTFVEIVCQAIYEYNYEQVHSSIGCAPIERYRGSGAAARMITEAGLAALWLPVHRDGGRRQVHTTGVKVTFDETYFYQAPELATLVGRKVQVRAQLCRTDRVAVFSGDDRSGYKEFVCFAKRSTTLTATECNEIAATGVAQSRAVSATHRRVRRALEQRAEDIATGTDRDLVEALVASGDRTTVEVSAIDGNKGTGGHEGKGGDEGNDVSEAAADATASDEVRRRGRRPTTRKAAPATKKSPALPASSSQRTKKDAALVAMAKDAMARHDTATNQDRTGARKAQAKPAAAASRRQASSRSTGRSSNVRKSSRKSR